jgi:DnaJ family protein C protein 13
MHLFSSTNWNEVRQKMIDMAMKCVGTGIKVLKDPITLDEFTAQRLGKFSGDEHVTSISEFSIYKVHSGRHHEPQRRTLCLSETCLLERDPQTYSICTLRPLAEIFALVRSQDNPQLFNVEYINGQVRTYTATDRDALLASLLDGVRASGNRDVHVKMVPTPRGKRIGPLSVPVEEEIESSHLRFIQQPPPKKSFAEIVERFNANIPYSGLLHSVTQESLFAENKDKLITKALQALVQREGDQSTISLTELEAQFQALRRLVASKVGFASFTTLAGFRESVGLKVVKALKREDEGVTHAAITWCVP